MKTLFYKVKGDMKLKEFTVGALIDLLKQFDQNANVVIYVNDDSSSPVIDAQYTGFGEVELLYEDF